MALVGAVCHWMILVGGFLGDSAFRIVGGSSVREITQTGCSGKRFTAREEKNGKRKGKPLDSVAVISMISPI